MRAWTIEDSEQLYGIPNWGREFVRINERGNVTITPEGTDGPSIDLEELACDLERRGIGLPILLRFPDLLKARINAIAGAFKDAMAEADYKGGFRGVYPIKVNQERHVVEDIVRFSRPHHMGLEAGSKPELLIVLSLVEDPEALVLCNGYKDREYIEMALMAKKIGRNPIIVIEKLSEIPLVIEASRRLGIEPTMGLRAKLASRGSGRWEDSTGDRAKFGLTIRELVEAVDLLRQEGMLHCLQLMHFHIGSQVSAIRAFKNALREASRIFVELHAMGAPLRFFDVGGGLGVDYDGSRTNFHSSINYSVQEYANDVVYAIASACDDREIPHPAIITESGRATVAHHAVLIFNVLGVIEQGSTHPDQDLQITEDDPDLLHDLREVAQGITRKNYTESWHDAVQAREEMLSMFNLGLLDLRQRARGEELFWRIANRVSGIMTEQSYVPEELENLEKQLADTYFCNFSVFQSLPDSWAIGQLFPLIPIHRHNERPSRSAVLADITCDSDGKINKFIDLHDVKDVLSLHPLNDRPYHLGVFLVGAYQEILGDLHNLFGDTNAVHVTLTSDGHYRVDSVVEGDTVSDVLNYVSYSRKDMVRRFRAACEKALRNGQMTLEDSARLIAMFQTELEGYTYLE